jgi:hypothetical protein
MRIFVTSPYRAVGTLALLGSLALAAGCSPHGTARAAGDAADRPALDGVTWYDGTSWVEVELRTGAVEGPGEEGSPKARFQSRLGGPKSFFVVAGAESELEIASARPRFRAETDGATARRAQIAPLEVKDESRITPIETTKGISIFKQGVAVEATKVRDGLWELRPKKSLQPGEYLLAISAAEPVVTFRIAERGY